jgi:hypothetical protein
VLAALTLRQAQGEEIELILTLSLSKDEDQLGQKSMF